MRLFVLTALVLSLLACAPVEPSAVEADGVVQALFGDSFSARFHAATPPAVMSRVEGPCVIERSTPRSLDLVSAGEVRLSASSECAASPNADLEYYCLGSSALYAPGDVVRVEATGAAFPAFTTEVVAPSPGTDISATEQPDGSLRFAWAGGTGRAYVVAGASSATELLVIECAVDAADGALMIPGSVRAELRELSATAPLSLSFVERRSVDVAGRRVRVEVGFLGARL